MYLVNAEVNRISAVQKKKFSDLGLNERGHLQEWLAYQPDALGEELLIIQKEFNGFDGTYERLDLLALDKQGNLIIIENKLDDSGRDVVWQALKYASYCASLTKDQIVEIFQKYLNRYGQVIADAAEGIVEAKETTNAVELICDFMEAEFDEVSLNQGNSQRIMLVAANFRKEVTSTALWLLGQGISVQCFKVSLYQLNQQSLINIDQIIPPPEAKDFMIGMGVKEAEEKKTLIVASASQKVRMQYWERVLEAFKSSDCRLYDSINPNKSYLLLTRSGQVGCNFGLAFTKQHIRIELWIEHSDAEYNKFLFDFLRQRKVSIEAIFGQPLEWLRKDSMCFSVIQLSRESNSYNEESWPEFIRWHVEHMTRFEAALKDPLKEAADALMSRMN